MNTLVKINKKVIKKLSKLGHVKNFTETTTLFYQNHIPIVAYFVINGEIRLFKGKHLKSKITIGEIVGVKELLMDEPSTVSAVATSKSTLCYLDRSAIYSIIKSDDLKLAVFFQELLDN